MIKSLSIFRSVGQSSRSKVKHILICWGRGHIKCSRNVSCLLLFRMINLRTPVLRRRSRGGRVSGIGIFKIYSRTLKRLLLTDCTANKILYRTIAKWGILVINAFILTFIKWQIVLYPFLIKGLLITVIFQSQDMTSFFDNLAAYECVFGGVFLPLRILKCSSCPIQIVITQEYAFCNFKYRFDKWRWRKLTYWLNTVMHWHIILKIMPKCFVSSLHIRIDMASIDIHRKFLSVGRWLKSSKCN